ncbi:hypothetical protein LCGC14_3072900, partial [marine sediment metagenome]
PPLAAWQQLPVRAVLQPGRLDRVDHTLDAQKHRYRPTGRPEQIAWMNPARIDALCLEYFSEARLFQGVSAQREAVSDATLVLRPRVVVKQYIRPSVSGTMLTLGTGLIYNILGGSAHYRYVVCDLAVSVEGASGRAITTYTSAGQSGERLVTARADQLGPLVSYAFTKALEDVANQISADNDLLMRALSASREAPAAQGAALVWPAGTEP